jgi:hypothetical protein
MEQLFWVYCMCWWHVWPLGLDWVHDVGFVPASRAKLPSPFVT